MCRSCQAVEVSSIVSLCSAAPRSADGRPKLKGHVETGMSCPAWPSAPDPPPPCLVGLPDPCHAFKSHFVTCHLSLYLSLSTSHVLSSFPFLCLSMTDGQTRSRNYIIFLSCLLLLWLADRPPPLCLVRVSLPSLPSIKWDARLGINRCFGVLYTEMCGIMEC